MGAYLSQNIVSIIFGITTAITSIIALRYMRLEHRREVEEVIDGGRKVKLFLSRETMIKYLLEMYDQAGEGDVIWAQCVRCVDFTPKVRTKILEAAGRGVRFQMVVYKHSPAVDDFRALFEPIENAEVIEVPGIALSLQGLSNREVVIAFPSMDSYTSVLIRDQDFVRIVKAWFDNQFDALERRGKEKEYTRIRPRCD
jgi:hypothetical protein